MQVENCRGVELEALVGVKKFAICAVVATFEHEDNEGQGALLLHPLPASLLRWYLIADKENCDNSKARKFTQSNFHEVYILK